MPEKKTNLKKKEDHSLSVLMKEYDSLRDMYNQSVHNGQTMFNYYLTLMTAVFGGITFVASPSSGVLFTRSTIAFLLIFLAVIGTFYLSSLTSNHAHSVRYAKGVNALRRHIIATYGVSMPAAYDKFLTQAADDKSTRLVFFLSLFIPVSTYQLFAATINSLSWGFMVAMVYVSSVSTFTSVLRIAFPGVLALIVTFLIYSIYSRLIFQMTVNRATVSVEL